MYRVYLHYVYTDVQIQHFYFAGAGNFREGKTDGMEEEKHV